jgi:citrate lyase subunit beta/citryl-CoA lyase
MSVITAEPRADQSIATTPRGDSLRKFESALRSDADALILDLEDAVAPAAKTAARQTTLRMLQTPAARAKTLFVRINAPDTAQMLDDLAAVMPAQPWGIVLPKCEGPGDVQRLSHYLSAFETSASLARGSTRIMAIAIETAASLFTLGAYADSGPRLWGMMWGAEDLKTSLGTHESRAGERWLDPFRLARSLCLAGAAAAGVLAVDTVETQLDDLEAVRRAALEARRFGFGAKAVIHPKHVAVVNEALSATAQELSWARRVVAAFEADPSAGAVRLDEKMVDRPHLRAALRLLGDDAPAAG